MIFLSFLKLKFKLQYATEEGGGGGGGGGGVQCRQVITRN